MKNKYFLNENGEAQVAIALIFLVFSLMFTSASMSYYANSIYHNESVSSITFPTGAKSYPSEQNFATGQYNKSTWNMVGSREFEVQENIGVVLILNDPIHTWSWLYLANQVKDSNGYITNTYYINNSVHGPYVIPLRYTGSSDQNEIRIDSDGFHIPNYVIPSLGFNNPVPLGDLYFYPYANAKDIDYPTIKTVYNDDIPSVTFYFNNEELFTTYDLKTDGNWFNLFPRYYAGVASNTLGFTLVAFNTENSIQLSDDTSLINMVLNFITTMLQIIVWTIPENILPLVLNIILIKTQLAGIIICLVIIARG